MTGRFEPTLQAARPGLWVFTKWRSKGALHGRKQA